MMCLFCEDEETEITESDNLPAGVSSDDHDLYKQVREKALEVSHFFQTAFLFALSYWFIIYKRF